MKCSIMMRRRPRWGLALAAAMLVQGCAGGFPQWGGGGTGAGNTDQVVVPEPEPTVTAPAKPRAKPAATPKLGATTTARDTSVTPAKETDLNLEVTYFVRILVPVGSELSVRADGSGVPSIKTIKTEAGPPYAITLPVDGSDGSFPMKITATLNSTIGHVLEGEVTLAGEPDKPVEIVLVPKS